MGLELPHGRGVLSSVVLCSRNRAIEDHGSVSPGWGLCGNWLCQVFGSFSSTLWFRQKVQSPVWHSQLSHRGIVILQTTLLWFRWVFLKGPLGRYGRLLRGGAYWEVIGKMSSRGPSGPGLSPHSASWLEMSIFFWQPFLPLPSGALTGDQTSGAI